MRRLLLLLPFTAACALFEDSTPREELVRRRARWEALGIRDYDFTFRRVCYCLPEDVQRVRVEVRAGSIARIVNRQTGEPVVSSDRWPTVDSLFVWTERHFEDGYRITLDFDEVHHFPTRVTGDIPQYADDEFDYLSSEFVRR